MPQPHYNHENSIWRLAPADRPGTWRSRPRPQPVERTRECVLCRITFTPRYLTPLDLRDMIVCPPCRVRELEYNVKSRRRDDDEEYHPAIPRPEAYDPPP